VRLSGSLDGAEILVHVVTSAAADVNRAAFSASAAAAAAAKAERVFDKGAAATQAHLLELQAEVLTDEGA